MRRKWDKAVHEFRLWRIKKRQPVEMIIAQRELKAARRAHRPTKHIIARMKRIAHEGLRT